LKLEILLPTVSRPVLEMNLVVSLIGMETTGEGRKEPSE
jgi:hypothetical protein